ncbi:hypothetical protein LTR36_003335 [Oleoguttula mirabilis]|uniref:U6 snRNA phosphodiesterase n=1 Tax=Oleoguttula mirabilis TaxID=1507867 RepID=A0AAV9K0H9_9PEZI|nr:hypothetical protein LTR36_003335 [Oleoguttula mirabilis]
MALVEYSDSEEEGDDNLPTPPPPAKKRRVSTHATKKTGDELPPLPTTFLDLYSSTARTSTQDDPSLHGGRKRVTPHVEGHWPTHVYLEWHPQPAESQALATLIAAQSKARPASRPAEDSSVHSLLQNELGVSLPLHVSLSRPLVLKTEQRAAFLDQLKKSIQNAGVRAFSAQPAKLKWHPNETGSRYFLVLGLQRPENDELRQLLSAANDVARRFEQPLLYEGKGFDRGKLDADAPFTAAGGADDGKFHISIAWSLTSPPQDGAHPPASIGGLVKAAEAQGSSLATATQDLGIAFSEVKVRIGQDVTSVPLPAPRRKGLF